MNTKNYMLKIAAIVIAIGCFTAMTSSALIASYQQGVDGYTDTVDTHVSSSGTLTDNSGQVFFRNSETSPTQDALLRFDNIIGTGAGQIPGPGSEGRAVVVNAYGDAASSITPARLGGDPARFVGFRLSGVDTAAAVVALGVEIIIDWVVLGVVSLLLAAAFGGEALRGVRDLLQGLTSSAVLPWLLGVMALVLNLSPDALRADHGRASSMSLHTK